MMPEMDGIEATRIIRNEINTDYARNIPIIALTANALSGNEEMFLENGFSSFLSKPIDIMLLDVALNQFVRNKEKEAIFVSEKSEEKTQEKNSDGESNTSHAKKTTKKNFFTTAIEGINIRQGIARYESEEIFLRVLESYAAYTPELLKKLKNFTEKTIADYTIAVHGLKSSSFGIFADHIGKQAEELETLAKTGNSAAVFEKNPALIESGEKLVKALNTALKAAKNTTGKLKMHEGIDSNVLAVIQDAAKHFKTQILDEAVKSLIQFNYTNKQDAELVAWIREQAENLEYEAIQKRLENL